MSSVWMCVFGAFLITSVELVNLVAKRSEDGAVGWFGLVDCAAAVFHQEGKRCSAGG